METNNRCEDGQLPFKRRKTTTFVRATGTPSISPVLLGSEKNDAKVASERGVTLNEDRFGFAYIIRLTNRKEEILNLNSSRRK
jgi:hypothetical protein